MKYFLFLVPVMILSQSLSCHRSGGRLEDAGSEEGPATGQAGEIVLTRQQFETSAMRVGDPATMIFHNEVSTTGYIVSSLAGRAKINSIISGRVCQISHSVGDKVQKGTVLFSLEGEEIIKAQQDYAVAFQELRVLRSDYERLKSLSEERLAATKDYLKAESDYRSKVAQAEGLKARLGLLHLDPTEIEKGHIQPVIQVTSPLQGMISRQDLVMGQYVEPRETAMEVVDQQQFRLSLLVYERSVSELETGQKIAFFTPDRSDVHYKAILSHIGTSIDPVKRTIQCYADILPENRGGFIENTFVEARITTCEREALALPEEALIRETERDFVLVLVDKTEESFTFRRVPVRTGVTRNGYTEILDGDLTAVLTVGAYNLSTGD